MAFALSSLLNPDSTEDETKTEEPQLEIQAQSPPQRRGSLPISSLLSPEQAHAQLPKYTPPERPRRPSSNVAQQARPAGLSGDGSVSSTADPAQAVSSSPVLERREDGESVLQQELVSQGGGMASQKAASVEVVNTDVKPVAASDFDTSEAMNVDIKLETEPSPVPSLSSRPISSSITNEPLTSLKQEHISRTQSPLRESSVILPTTEDQSPAPQSTMKKRPPPSKAKKGTATTAKKSKAPTKKRKVDKTKPSKNGRSLNASSPVPSDARSYSEEVDDEDEEESEADSNDDVEGSGDVYCICRKPDNGTFMIGCDGQCDDWFHGKCVGIEERDKNLMSNYICPSCTAKGVGRTSWKRMCRRSGCRQPARVGRNANKDGSTSKYCSDECGVLFFREMTAHARGSDQSKKNRRKSGAVGDVAMPDPGLARGGSLSVGEVKALLDKSNTATEFKAIGNGVLSPPPTPDGKSSDETVFTEAETAKLKAIELDKDEARQRHHTLKDRLLFVSYVKAEAVRVAAKNELKPKDYCGFDSRVNWSEEDFTEWRNSPSGVSVFERQTLEPLTDGAADETHMEVVGEENDEVVCTRKKCARHADWAKLAVDEIRFEMGDNSDRMRNLEQQEQDLKDHAAVNAKQSKTKDGGSVQWYDGAEPALGQGNADDSVMADQLGTSLVNGRDTT